MDIQVCSFQNIFVQSLSFY